MAVHADGRQCPDSIRIAVAKHATARTPARSEVG